MDEILKELDKILPVVVRVHSDNHPELKLVGELYPTLRSAINAGDSELAASVFRNLKGVTDGFTVPADACPTYARTYQDLAWLDGKLPQD